MRLFALGWQFDWSSLFRRMSMGDAMNGRQRRDFLKVTGAAGAGWLAASNARAQPPRPRIKIGQVGVAHGHANKLAVFRRSADYEVVGIVEPDRALRERAETQDAF